MNSTDNIKYLEGTIFLIYCLFCLFILNAIYIAFKTQNEKRNINSFVKIPDTFYLWTNFTGHNSLQLLKVIVKIYPKQQWSQNNNLSIYISFMIKGELIHWNNKYWGRIKGIKVC